jgi:hypothetical protein
MSSQRYESERIELGFRLFQFTMARLQRESREARKRPGSTMNRIEGKEGKGFDVEGRKIW